MKRKVTKQKKNTIIDFIVAFFLIFGALFLLYSLLFQPPVSPPTTTTVAKPLTPPAKGFLMGISFYDTNLSSFVALQDRLHIPFQIIGLYQAWGSENNRFPTKFVEEVANLQAVPLITWEPWKPVGGFDRSENLVQQDEYRLPLITKGKYDAYIHQYAAAVASYKKPVLIRLAHEMNGNWYSWGSKFNTPDEYIAMWRHVREIFTKEKVTNASFIWSPNVLYDEPSIPYSSDIEKFYPGDTFVDWVGMSGFNWAGTYKNNTWIEPDALFTPTLNKLEIYHKPIMISETGSAEANDGNSKAAWISNLRSFLSSHQTIKALVWFNVEDNGINWKIDSSTPSEKAFQEAFSH